MNEYDEIRSHNYKYLHHIKEFEYHQILFIRFNVILYIRKTLK
jgi:hypothetical protein